MPDSTADAVAVEALAEEFLARRRRGESPTVAEYLSRHPALADQIAAVFPVLGLVEEFKPGPDDPTGSLAGLPIPGHSRPLERLGDFRILREVGRGGMGVVYEAEQESLGRRVALKVIADPRLSHPRLLARFEREARAAGRLHHTNIVPVFGAGEAAGLHYYVMQFIHGRGLDAVLAELADGSDPGDAPSSLGHPGRSGYAASVARVGLQAAEALAHAHEQGVLHRDIKPSNLLLDIHGVTWVADFGLAKSAEDEALTQTDDLVGTLRYMAPERFRGQCDARSDVYALGLTLYELLARRPAFDEPDRARLLRQVTSATPPPRLRALAPSTPRDLATIVHKSIEPDPAHRYPTARALADDLHRFLDDRPIAARRVGPAERAWRWSRRNPILATLTSTVAALLLLIALGSLLAAGRIDAQRLQAVAAGQKAAASARRADAEARTARDANETLRRTLYASRLNLIQAAWKANNPGRVRELLDLTRPASGETDLRGFEWYYWDRRLILPNRVLAGHKDRVETHRTEPVHRSGNERGSVASLTFGADSRTLASGGHDGLIRLWDAADGRLIREFPTHGSVGITALAISPDGTRLAAGGDDGSVRILDTTNGHHIVTLTGIAEDHTVEWLGFGPDGSKLAGVECNDISNSTLLWEIGNPIPKCKFANSSASMTIRPTFSGDGRLFAHADQNGGVGIREVDSGRELFAILSKSWISTCRFHPGDTKGQHLDTIDHEGNRLTWNISDTGRPPECEAEEVVAGESGLVHFTASGLKIVHEYDSHVGLSMGPGNITYYLEGYSLDNAALSPDGRTIAAVDGGYSIKVYSAPAQPLERCLSVNPQYSPEKIPTGGSLNPTFSPSGSRLLYRMAGDDIRIWGRNEGRELMRWKGSVAALSLDGACVWIVRPASSASSQSQEFTAYETESGRPMATIVERSLWQVLKPNNKTGLIDTTPDGRIVIVQGGDQYFCWDVARSQIVSRLESTGDHRFHLNPDGRRAFGYFYRDDIMCLARWEVATGELFSWTELPKFNRLPYSTTLPLFSSDGSLAMLVDEHHRDWFGIWDAQKGQILHKIRGRLNRSDFSRSGTRFATIASDDKIRIWDATSGLELLEIEASPLASSVSLSPDGRALTAGGLDEVWIWDFAARDGLEVVEKEP